MTRLKVAELTSGIGALILGVGLGALFPEWFSASAGLITMAGVVTHGFGMWDKHRLEGEPRGAAEPWVTALYWACWLLIVGVLIVVFVRG